MKPKIILCLALVLSFLLTGCAHIPHMTQVSVIQVANHAATAEGYHLKKFDAPDADFEISEHDHMWSVFYRNKKRPFSAEKNFWIMVDDRTGETFVAKLYVKLQ
jgi:hypothetical protein